MTRRPAANVAGVLAVVLAIVATFTAPRAAAAEPEQVTIGVFLTGLNNLNFAAGTAAVDFWIWTVVDGETRPRSPLETAYIVNEAAKTTEPILTEKQGSRRWDQQRIRATVNNRFDTSHFPFDRQTVQIVIEESFGTTAELLFVADRERSGIAQSVSLTGWSVTGWSVATEEHPYPTNFGDLRHPGPVQSSRLIFNVDLQRHGLALFVDLSIGAVVAFLIMALTFRMNPTLPPIFAGRMGVTAATVFTTLISMRVNSGNIEAPFGSTLIDRIHLVTLGAGFLVGIAAVIARSYAETGSEAAALQLDRRLLPIFVILYAAVVLAMIVGAVWR
ncbi:MAG TPA: hypothetical protein VGB82_05580 [Alphaproteobacteria bacterium]